MFSKRDQGDGDETGKKNKEKLLVFLSKISKIYHMTEERDKEGWGKRRPDD